MSRISDLIRIVLIFFLAILHFTCSKDAGMFEGIIYPYCQLSPDGQKIFALRSYSIEQHFKDISSENGISYQYEKVVISFLSLNTKGNVIDTFDFYNGNSASEDISILCVNNTHVAYKINSVLKFITLNDEGYIVDTISSNYFSSNNLYESAAFVSDTELLISSINANQTTFDIMNVNTLKKSYFWDIPGGFFFAKGNFEYDAAYIFSEYNVLRLNVQTKQIDSLDYPLSNRFNYRVSQNQAVVRTDSSFLFYEDGTKISEYLTCGRSNYEDFSADKYGMFILYKAFDDMIYILNTEDKESILLFPYEFENRL